MNFQSPKPTPSFTNSLAIILLSSYFFFIHWLTKKHIFKWTFLTSASFWLQHRSILPEGKVICRLSFGNVYHGECVGWFDLYWVWGWLEFWKLFETDQIPRGNMAVRHLLRRRNECENNSSMNTPINRIGNKKY